MPNKRFVLISPKNRTVYNFRGDLIKEIISRGYDVTVVGPNKDNLDKILELGVEFKEIPMHKNGVNPLSDISYTFKLMRFLKQESPDIVLGYTIKPVVYGTIAAWIAGTENIYAMITGVGYTFISQSVKAKLINKFVKILYKISFGKTRNVIFQNIDDCNEFVSQGLVNKEKCVVVAGSGVNMDRFMCKTYPQTITFFMLSRIMRSKGVTEYLNACKKVKSIYKDRVRFMLLGAMENIQDSLSADHIQEYVDDGIIEYFGETNDVAEFYKQCSVYVLPSYREGTPRTVLEAMAMGRPIITTDAPGCRETVKDGVNGFLVPVKDSEELVEKMIYFIEHEDKIFQMGEESYRYCKEKFDVHKVNKDMCSIMNI